MNNGQGKDNQGMTKCKLNEMRTDECTKAMKNGQNEQTNTNAKQQIG